MFVHILIRSADQLRAVDGFYGVNGLLVLLSGMRNRELQTIYFSKAEPSCQLFQEMHCVTKKEWVASNENTNEGNYIKYSHDHEHLDKENGERISVHRGENGSVRVLYDVSIKHRNCDEALCSGGEQMHHHHWGKLSASADVFCELKITIFSDINMVRLT